MRLGPARLENLSHKYFNPRIPAGCDSMSIAISTEDRDFNPRIPAGCDAVGEQKQHMNLNFNPRIPAGCDGAVRHDLDRCRYFNPRIPAGCDIYRMGIRDQLKISIHASLRDATIIPNSNPHSRIRFQSTHPCGMRPSLRQSWIS